MALATPTVVTSKTRRGAATSPKTSPDARVRPSDDTIAKLIAFAAPPSTNAPPRDERHFRDSGQRSIETPLGLSPFTLEPMASVPCSSADDVTNSVASARAAQKAWAARPFPERAAIFLRLHDLLLERQDEVLDLIQWETGKARFHAYQEIAQATTLARHYARRGRHYLREKRHRGFLIGFTKVRELRVPRGVIGIISPWNYPLYLGVGDAIPALLAGNAVVSKPDPQTPLTLLWTRALLLEAGLPEDVWQVVVGDGEVVGSALIDAVDYIGFTGSTKTGRIVAERAARRLIGASLELGGKNPLLVCEDADVEAAAQGVVLGAFTNAGQMCIHLERAYVHQAVYVEFAQKLVAATEALVLGQTYDYTAEIGCLVSAEHLRKVDGHVTDAVQKGARVLSGGRARLDIGPLAYEPTVLEGVTPEMDVYGEETFGPVLSLYRVASDEEAIERANDSPYGLSASVWSRDATRADAIARQLRCGAVNINDGAAAAAGSIEAPMGGMRASGLGRRHGAEGILKYTEAQTIAAQRLVPLAPPKGVSLQSYAGLITKQLRFMRAFRVR